MLQENDFKLVIIDVFYKHAKLLVKRYMFGFCSEKINLDPNPPIQTPYTHIHMILI